MSDDLEALKRAWEEVDVEAIAMAMDTGKIRNRYTTSLWLMSGITVFLVASLIHLALSPLGLLWKGLMLAILLPLAGIFLRFFRRQRASIHAADALLQAAAPDVVRGRIALLEVELFAWAGPAARFSEQILAPFAGIGLLWMASVAPTWIGSAIPVGIGIGMVVFLLYGRLWRAPALRDEIASLQALADSLADPS